MRKGQMLSGLDGQLKGKRPVSMTVLISYIILFELRMWARKLSQPC